MAIRTIGIMIGLAGLALASLLGATREELENQKKRKEILDYYIVRVDSVDCIFRIGFLVPEEVVWESHILSLGKPAEAILENGGFQARRYARQNPGDWVACSIETGQGDTLRLWQADFGFVYGDTVVWAVDYISTESMFEFELYTPSDLLQFPGAIHPRKWGGLALWVRFLAGTFEKTGMLATKGYAFEAPESVIIVNRWKGW